jgi:hypothetical protein
MLGNSLHKSPTCALILAGDPMDPSASSVKILVRWTCLIRLLILTWRLNIECYVVCITLLMARSHQTFHLVLAVKLLGIMLRIDVGPPLFTLLQPKMPTDGVRTDRCDQPLCCVSMFHGFKYHNFIQIHNNVLWDWQTFAKYSSYSVWMWGIFCIIFSISLLWVWIMLWCARHYCLF